MPLPLGPNWLLFEFSCAMLCFVLYNVVVLRLCPFALVVDTCILLSEMCEVPLGVAVGAAVLVPLECFGLICGI